MTIKVWGARGSLPTPGKEMNSYGGNTTCLEVRLNDGTLLIVDAGSGIRNLGKKILQDKGIEEIYLYLTHSHWDHLMGFPFFIPAYIKRYKIHVRGGLVAKSSLKKYLAHQLDPPYFPVSYKILQAEFDFSQGDPKKKKIGQAELIPIPLSHPGGGYGFSLTEDGKTFVFLTDNELSFDHGTGLSVSEYTEISQGADLLIHDAQYTNDEYKMKKSWGHSTFREVTVMALSANVARLGIFHHDPDRTDEALDRCLEECKSILEQEESEMEFFGIREGMEIEL
jgi:phosphoribosyl 1,2-cyclic phosphodiesterase